MEPPHWVLFNKASALMIILGWFNCMYFLPQEGLQSALVLEIFHVWKRLPLFPIFEWQYDNGSYSPGSPSAQLGGHGFSVSWLILEVTATHPGGAWELTALVLIFLGRGHDLSLCRCSPCFVSEIFSSCTLFFLLPSLWFSWSLGQLE